MDVATLRHALAMLPTETKFCKPALLPHKTLRCTGDDLEVDGKVLASTESRTAQLQEYNQKALCVDYKKLLGLSFKGERREVFKNQIVYVFHNTIDAEGHDSSAKSFTTACRNAIDELRQLVAYLHDTANVSDVFVTADHGFLYNDQAFEEKDKQKVEETCCESKTRYYITTSAEDKEGITKFKLSEVSAMTGDYYVAVPLGTNRLAAPAGGYAFAHGGAALQEVIIPIVHSKYKRENEKEKVGVELLEQALCIVSSRLKVHLVQKEAVDMTRTERKIVCGLFQEGKPVAKTEELTLSSRDSDAKRRVVELNFNVSLGEGGGILQFKVFDKADEHNPLISTNVINRTLIEQDDF
ncbi:MAG: PglZ domain-containing protein [Clostridia bacterium]|nr:PglZ domain-containing protein [Clostridia bacterium]